MIPFIILCSLVVLLVLLVRTSALRKATERHECELRTLELRVKELQDAQNAFQNQVVATTTSQAQAEAVPPQAPSSDNPWTLVAPPPAPEPELTPLTIEATATGELPVKAEPTVPLEIGEPASATLPPAPVVSDYVQSTLAPEPEPSLETIPVAPPASQVPVAPPEPPQSFELRLGTYWFVRMGVVILLTGFVFLANLAYRQIVPQLGAAGKVALLYVGSAALLGVGAWLQRRQAKETLRNYAHVLLAGGLGAVYFTTYAAHHYEPLRVVGSAVLDGALLLGWAGFIVWLANRRKSETLALFALGLGFYTAVVTRVGTFTLASNLVLTIATVFFLVRNRWAHLTLAGLVAS